MLPSLARHWPFVHSTPPCTRTTVELDRVGVDLAAGLRGREIGAALVAHCNRVDSLPIMIPPPPVLSNGVFSGVQVS